MSEETRSVGNIFENAQQLDRGDSSQDWRRDWIPLGEGKPRVWQEGELTVHRSTAWSAPGCHEGCGVLIYTDAAGKLVKVEGDPDAPFNQGRLCPRCLAVKEMMYDPDRVIYPMKRDPKDRGKNKWIRCSWDEALDEIAEKFNSIKERYGAEAVSFHWGTGRDGFQYMQRLAYSFGSPNCVYPLSGTSCYLPRIAAMFNIAGFECIADCSQEYFDRYDNPQYTAPELYICWGHNPVYASSDGFFGHWVVDLMKRGTKLVTIDPRVTWLAAHSEMHLQINNGTDGALAMALLNVIINEKLYDADFVDKWTYGFDELAERVQKYTPEYSAEITGIPAAKIERLARRYAAASPAVIHWGLAIDMANRESIPTAQGILALMAITGNMDVSGGELIPVMIQNTGFGWGTDLLDQSIINTRLGVEEYPFCGRGFLLNQTEVSLQAMETDKPRIMRGAWLETTNPLVNCGADPDRWKRAYERMEINVVLDYTMTPTAMAIADYFLPVAMFPERNGLRVCEGPQFGEVWKKVCTTGEVKADLEICIEMGKRLNPEAWQYDSDTECYTEILGMSKVPVTFEECYEYGPIYPKPHLYEFKKYEKGLLRPDGQLGFMTPTGRIELWSSSLAQCGLDPLPEFCEPVPGKKTTPELFEKYPLVLTTGARSINYFHSEHRQAPHLRAIKPEPLCEINPADARRYGIKDGDMVWIENYMGRAKRRAVVTEAVKEGLISSDHGWWLPEVKDESNWGGVNDININRCLESVSGKSGFGTNFKATCCKIYKVEGDN